MTDVQENQKHRITLVDYLEGVDILELLIQQLRNEESNNCSSNELSIV